MMRFTIAVAALLCLALGVHAQEIVSPVKGSALRSDVLNALRPTAERETGGSVQFVVRTLRVMSDWAYVSAEPVRPGGNAIDWRKTKFRRAYEADAFSGVILALLHRQDGGWTVTEYAIGPTDVAWVDWLAKHKVPEALFKTD